MFLILLQRVRSASTKPRQEDQQQEEPWLLNGWVGLVRQDQKRKGIEVLDCNLNWFASDGQFTKKKKQEGVDWHDSWGRIG